MENPAFLKSFIVESCRLPFGRPMERTLPAFFLMALPSCGKGKGRYSTRGSDFWQSLVAHGLEGGGQPAGAPRVLSPKKPYTMNTVLCDTARREPP
jgi:hypothetical protein